MHYKHGNAVMPYIRSVLLHSNILLVEVRKQHQLTFQVSETRALLKLKDEQFSYAQTGALSQDLSELFIMFFLILLMWLQLCLKCNNHSAGKPLGLYSQCSLRGFGPPLLNNSINVTYFLFCFPFSMPHFQSMSKIMHFNG